eukprot:7590955-Alexandrium_andersonii.AAC.1
MEAHCECPDQGPAHFPQERNQPPAGGGEAPNVDHPRREPLSIEGASEHGPQRFDESPEPGD